MSSIEESEIGRALIRLYGENYFKNSKCIDEIDRIREGLWEPYDFKGFYKFLSPNKTYFLISTGHYFITSIKQIRSLICIALSKEEPLLYEGAGLIFENNSNKMSFNELKKPGRILTFEKNIVDGYYNSYFYNLKLDKDIIMADSISSEEEYQAKYQECRKYWRGQASSFEKDQLDFIPND